MESYIYFLIINPRDPRLSINLGIPKSKQHSWGIKEMKAELAKQFHSCKRILASTKTDHCWLNIFVTHRAKTLCIYLIN